MPHAIADGKAAPMTVVIPDTHCPPPHQNHRTEVGHQLDEKIRAEERELFEDKEFGAPP